MANIREALGIFTYLRAADVPADSPLSATIDAIDIVQVAEKDEETKTEKLVAKAVLGFREIRDRLMLNKTNLDVICSRHGEDSDGWMGQRLTIYRDVCDFRGRRTDCLRLEPPKNGRPVAPSQAPADAKPADANSPAAAIDPVVLQQQMEQLRQQLAAIGGDQT
jgi:hypothetical protein